MQTRIGIGATFIDHGAGMPIQPSRPLGLSQPMEQSGTWDTGAQRWSDDAPVDLPMARSSRWTILLLLASIIVALAVACFSLVFGSPGENVIAPGHLSRSEHVPPPTGEPAEQAKPIPK